MIPDFLKGSIESSYWADLSKAALNGDFSSIKKRYEDLEARDPLMRPFNGEAGTKYYKPFVQSVAPKILPTIKESIRKGRPPEIVISFNEIDSTRSQLGIPGFGSRQDVLYAFTSERYQNWGQTLTGMGFTSACMSKPTEMVVTMAPRFLALGKPDEEIRELSGTISEEFYETTRVVFNELSIWQRYKDFCNSKGLEEIPLEDPCFDAVLKVKDQLESLPYGLSAKLEINREILLKGLKDIGPDSSKRKIKTLLGTTGPRETDIGQEQIVLKYITEGNYLQKLLGGQRIEHIQSNIKMKPNLLRDYKCEVDALYRVVGQKRVVLLEAKGKEDISRAQLYGVYETFRSSLPIDWDLDVVAALVNEPSESQRSSGFKKCIDLVKVGIAPNLPQTFTERLLEVKTQSHFRWLIP